MHFKTQHSVVRRLAWDGVRGAGNHPAIWRTGFSGLPGHSTHLPAETDAVGNGDAQNVTLGGFKATRLATPPKKKGKKK